MLSKNKIKHINSLKTKKHRDLEQCFIAEGNKLVNEILISELEVVTLIAEQKWLTENHKVKSNIEIIEATTDELSKITALVSPQQVLAVVKIPKRAFDLDQISQNLSLILDNIQDPGNMGTIIRLCDWFGIKNIFCSQGCVDWFNPKVVQATMGAICRIQLHEIDVPQFLQNTLQKYSLPIYGTFLEGENIYTSNLLNKGFIVMGNEGHGISKEVEVLVTNKLLIPSFSSDQPTSESLNVSIATAIICSEFKRRI